MVILDYQCYFGYIFIPVYHCFFFFFFLLLFFLLCLVLAIISAIFAMFSPGYQFSFFFFFFFFFLLCLAVAIGVRLGTFSPDY